MVMEYRDKKNGAPEKKRNRDSSKKKYIAKPIFDSTRSSITNSIENVPVKKVRIAIENSSFEENKMTNAQEISTTVSLHEQMSQLHPFKEVPNQIT